MREVHNVVLVVVAVFITAAVAVVVVVDDAIGVVVMVVTAAAVIVFLTATVVVVVAAVYVAVVVNSAAVVVILPSLSLKITGRLTVDPEVKISAHITTVFPSYCKKIRSLNFCFAIFFQVSPTSLCPLKSIDRSESGRGCFFFEAV